MIFFKKSPPFIQSCLKYEEFSFSILFAQLQPFVTVKENQKRKLIIIWWNEVVTRNSGMFSRYENLMPHCEQPFSQSSLFFNNFFYSYINTFTMDVTNKNKSNLRYIKHSLGKQYTVVPKLKKTKYS